MDVRVELEEKLSAKELILLNCGVGEDSWESLGLQGDPTSPSWRKSVLNIHWKDWCWSWNFITLSTWCEELTHLKRPCCWERLKEGGKGDDRGWDGWMNHQLSGHEFEQNSGRLKDREAWCAAVHGVAQSQIWLSSWTTAILVWKRKACIVLDTCAHFMVHHQTQGDVKTPLKDLPGPCAPEVTETWVPWLSLVLLVSVQVSPPQSHHLQWPLKHVSSFPPSLLYHVGCFHSFLFTIMISSSLAYSFEGHLFPPLRMKQGPWLANKQKAIPKTWLKLTPFKDHLISTDPESTRQMKKRDKMA